MEIKGKVYCLFEQSGTFKQEFIKLGIPAEDYDIQNHFGQTDHTDDLFKAIEDAYDGNPSLFENITPNDLVMAFFPCIYFCEYNRMWFDGTNRNYVNMTRAQMLDTIIRRGGAKRVILGTCNEIICGCRKEESAYDIGKSIQHTTLPFNTFSLQACRN